MVLGDPLGHAGIGKDEVVAHPSVSHERRAVRDMHAIFLVLDQAEEALCRLDDHRIDFNGVDANCGSAR